MIFLRNVVLFKICGKGVFQSTLKLLRLSTELIIFKNWEMTFLTHSRPIFHWCIPEKHQKFSDIFKDYRSGTMAWYGHLLLHLLICVLLFSLWYTADIASAWSEAYIFHSIFIHITLQLSTLSLSRGSFMLSWRVHVPICLESLRASRVNMCCELTCLCDNMPRNICLI